MVELSVLMGVGGWDDRKIVVEYVLAWTLVRYEIFILSQLLLLILLYGVIFYTLLEWCRLIVNGQ